MERTEKLTLTEPRNFLIDMDGVLVSGSTLIPGADQFIQRLHESGSKFLLLTNNSRHTPRDLAFNLQKIGLKINDNNIFTSALATALFLQKQKPNGTAYVIGESGLTTALYQAGYTPARQYVNAESTGLTASNVREVKASHLAEAQAPAADEALVFYSEEFERFKQGTFELECSNCGLGFALSQNEYKQLYDREDWRLLAQKVMKSNYRLDLAYFYLGKAAQGLGYEEAARIYLGKAAELSVETGSACARGWLVNCQEFDLTQAAGL